MFHYSMHHPKIKLLVCDTHRILIFLVCSILFLNVLDKFYFFSQHADKRPQKGEKRGQFAVRVSGEAGAGQAKKIGMGAWGWYSAWRWCYALGAA